jgi:TM2 domain-containing membrane protein YozV
MKSKGVAYLLWFFLGVVGAHKFYLGKVGMGVIYALTLGFLGVGLLIDLFTLGNQVDMYNALHGSRVNVQQNNNQNQNVVVNLTAPSAPVAQQRISAEKQVLSLSEKSPVLTIKQIVSQTDLEMEEADEVVKRMISKGLVKELIEADGKVKYDFS